MGNKELEIKETKMQSGELAEEELCALAHTLPGAMRNHTPAPSTGEPESQGDEHEHTQRRLNGAGRKPIIHRNALSLTESCLANSKKDSIAFLI